MSVVIVGGHDRMVRQIRRSVRIINGRRRYLPRCGPDWINRSDVPIF